MYNIEEIKNKIIYGDNLEIMKKIPDNSIDLVYLDPPFFTQQNWTKNGNSFSDKFKNIEEYIEFMSLRLKELHRVLKPNGIICLHCDRHAVDWLKIIMDKIFGLKNYQTRIIWQREQKSFGAKSNMMFPEMTDYILVYSKGKDFTYNIQYTPHAKEFENKFTNPDNDPKGKYIWQNFTGADTVPSEKSSKLNEQSEIKFLKQIKSGAYCYKRYWNDINRGGKFQRGMSAGKPMLNIWFDINRLTKSESEYPTQKPEALLERIIKASSNPGNIILDPFCGCGTCCVVSKRLNRNYIGIDINSNAIKICEERLFEDNKETKIKEKKEFI